MLAELKTEVCQNILVHALDAEPQKNRPYQSDIYTVSFHAIPRQAREQDSFDTFLLLETIDPDKSELIVFYHTYHVEVEFAGYFSSFL